MGCGASSDRLIIQSESEQNSKKANIKDHNHRQVASIINSPKIESKIRQEIVKIYEKNYNSTEIEKMLKQFQTQHDQIKILEKSKCFEHYRVILEELEQLNAKKLRTNQLYSDCLQRIHNLTKDNGLSKDISLREVVANKWIQKTELTKEDTEMIILLSKREILDISREKIAWQIDELKNESENYKNLCDDLQDYYEKRDNLLNTIFGPIYRSDQEFKFEKELEALLEERHFIECAKLRWIKAHEYLRDSIQFIHSAIDTLQKYEICLENDIDNRFILIQEARNDLHNYSLNIKSMKSILLNLNLPHTKTEDLLHLSLIISELFIQTFTNISISESLQFLINLQKQTNIQNKWIKEVLIGTIQRDLKNIRPQCENKSQELFMLRCFLARKLSTKDALRLDQIDSQKRKVYSNEDVLESSSGAIGQNKALANTLSKYFHDSPFELRADSGVDSELEENIHLSDDIKTLHRTVTNSGTDSDLSTTTPLLPGEELGPIPSNNEIFGKIQQLRRQHSQEMEYFEAAQSINRAKITQSLKEKLNDRRSRRYRMEMHRRQLEALQEFPQS